MTSVMRPMATGDVAAQGVSNALFELNGIRQRLADLYASVPAGTTVEEEIGDCLHVVRTACKRVRKAAGELLQAPLPLE